MVQGLRRSMAMVVSAAVLASCGGASSSSLSSKSGMPSATEHTRSTPTESAIPHEAPVPAESNPPGDIPDNTVFVPYRSRAGGFRFPVPEGWARSTSRHSVSFSDKLNTIEVSWQAASTAPTAGSTIKDVVPELKATQRAFRLVGVKSAPLPAGPAVLVSYQANSDPNKVTGQQYRLDVLRYELFNSGTEADITLLSPVGADNVDPWNTVTQGFAWT
jgi:hypothetical protein